MMAEVPRTQLPREIIREFIKYIPNRPPLLIGPLLVSRAWYRETLPYLYEEVNVNITEYLVKSPMPYLLGDTDREESKKGEVRTATCLVSGEDARKLVKKFTFWGDHWHQQEFSIILEFFLKNCPNLRTIEYEQTDDDGCYNMLDQYNNSLLNELGECNVGESKVEQIMYSDSGYHPEEYMNAIFPFRKTLKFITAHYYGMSFDSIRDLSTKAKYFRKFEHYLTRGLFPALKNLDMRFSLTDKLPGFEHLIPPTLDILTLDNLAEVEVSRHPASYNFFRVKPCSKLTRLEIQIDLQSNDSLTYLMKKFPKVSYLELNTDTNNSFVQFARQHPFSLSVDVKNKFARYLLGNVKKFIVDNICMQNSLDLITEMVMTNKDKYSIFCLRVDFNKAYDDFSSKPLVLNKNSIVSIRLEKKRFRLPLTTAGRRGRRYDIYVNLRDSPRLIDQLLCSLGPYLTELKVEGEKGYCKVNKKKYRWMTKVESNDDMDSDDDDKNTKYAVKIDDHDDHNGDSFHGEEYYDHYVSYSDSSDSGDSSDTNDFGEEYENSDSDHDDFSNWGSHRPFGIFGHHEETDEEYHSDNSFDEENREEVRHRENYNNQNSGINNKSINNRADNDNNENGDESKNSDGKIDLNIVLNSCPNLKVLELLGVIPSLDETTAIGKNDSIETLTITESNFSPDDLLKLQSYLSNLKETKKLKS